jgi:hypothetical protein
MRSRSGLLRGVLAGLLLGGTAVGAGAQGTAEPEAAEAISVELNATDPVESGCALTFMVGNGLSKPVEQVVYETVLIDTDGRVNRLTLFDFGELPAGRTRVRQFAVPDLECDALGQMLINGASTCTVAGAESNVCESGLTLTSRTDVEVVR